MPHEAISGYERESERFDRRADVLRNARMNIARVKVDMGQEIVLFGANSE